MSLQATPEGPSIGELLSNLARDTGALVRDEVKLAKVEVGAKVSSAAGNIGAILTAGALVHAGVLVMLAAAVIALGHVLPLWAAALIVGGLVTVTGYVLLQSGLAALKSFDVIPTQTMKSLEADKQWVKEQVQ